MAALTHLRLEDLSDEDILRAVVAVADPDGWVTAPEVAAHLEVEGDNPQRAASSRLAWMKRYGAMERELLWDEHGNPVTRRDGVQRTGQRWKLTALGSAIASGALAAGQQRLMDGLTEGQAVLLTGALAQHAQASGKAAGLAKRAWRRSWM